MMWRLKKTDLSRRFESEVFEFLVVEVAFIRTNSQMEMDDRFEGSFGKA